jgi:hypothetical protein
MCHPVLVAKSLEKSKWMSANVGSLLKSSLWAGWTLRAFSRKLLTRVLRNCSIRAARCWTRPADSARL